nr:hypothetical protein [Tanacetum cinerariifolium]
RQHHAAGELRHAPVLLKWPLWSAEAGVRGTPPRGCGRGDRQGGMPDGGRGMDRRASGNAQHRLTALRRAATA